MEETISLKEVLDILRKHLTTILMSTFIGIALAGIITFFVITPKYSSRAQLIVSLPQTETSNVNDINFNLQMLNTYKDIILQGDAQAQEVQSRLNNEYGIKITIAQLKDALEVSQAQNSQMFSIVATSDSPTTAQSIANITAEVFQENVKDILTNVDKITIVSSAVASSRPVSPNNKLNLIIGMFLGLMVGVMIAMILTLFDRTVKDQRFITDTLELTILGTVSQMSLKEISTKISEKNMKSNSLKNINKESEPMSRRNRARV